MKGLLAVVTAAALVVGVVGCGGGGDGSTLARVGSSSLSAAEFYASIPEQHLAVMTLEDQEEALRSWVKTELFYQEGGRLGLGSGDDIERRVREIERELVAEACIRERLSKIPAVTQADALEYFEEHKGEYGIQVRLAHILVRNTDEAARALAQLESGSPFETVAQSFSIDQTASLGGDLGYVRRGEMIHELEEEAFGLKVGEVSSVIASGYGYHIIKTLDRHPGAGQPSFESKQAVVMNFLTSKRRRKEFDSWLLDLESRAVVVVDTANLRRASRDRVGEIGTSSIDEDRADGDTTEFIAP
ncbi:peptidylprolyl isomerase [bacterium]|nr:peptidylprolyl isomerase [bacterium]